MSVYVLSTAAQARKSRHQLQLGSKQITKEQIVNALMPHTVEISTRVHPKGGHNVSYQVRLCPKGDLCTLVCKSTKLRGRIEFPVSQGYSNPHAHLLSCCFSNDADRMIGEYWEAQVSKQQQSTLKNYATASATTTNQKSPDSYHIISQKEKDLFDWVNMIINVGWPINCVTQTIYRDFHRGQSKFSKDTVREVIIAMTIQVEVILAAEMKDAGKGSIVHNAWSKFGSHFFALFATYKAKRDVVEDGIARTVIGPVVSLLSVAPLHTPVRETVDCHGFLPSAEEAEVEESTTFTAQAHFAHICDILRNYYEIDPATFLTNQTADSASVNLLLAKLLKIPHVNCENHLLNNELKMWMKNSTLPDDEIDRSGRSFGPGTVCKLIHECMVDLKNNKNRAILCKETDLSPTIGCATRWASAANMMNKYAKIEKEIANASADLDADIMIPPTSYSFNKALKTTTGILKDINYVSVMMQKQLTPLSRCQQLQSVIIESANQNRDNPSSHWYRNTFGHVYISPDSLKRPDRAFVSAVCKMQKQMGSELNADEKRAIKMWLPITATPLFSENRATTSIADLVAQLPGTVNGGGKRKADEISEEYNSNSDDCFDHVIGSAAVVERLWSVARYILTTNRSALSPVLFEALLFLRSNRTLWDVRTVQRALLAVREDQKSDRLKNKLAEVAEADGEDEDGEDTD